MKVPTHTATILAYLRESDDFRSARMILAALPGTNSQQASAALIHLRKVRAVDCVVEPDGVAWWYALPPKEDQRTKTVAERAPETHPRRRRRRKASP